MYRIYWLHSSGRWLLFAEANNEELAHDEFDNCRGSFPEEMVRMTREEIIREN